LWWTGLTHDPKEAILLQLDLGALFYEGIVNAAASLLGTGLTLVSAIGVGAALIYGLLEVMHRLHRWLFWSEQSRQQTPPPLPKEYKK